MEFSLLHTLAISFLVTTSPSAAPISLARMLCLILRELVGFEIGEGIWSVDNPREHFTMYTSQVLTKDKCPFPAFVCRDSKPFTLLQLFETSFLNSGGVVPDVDCSSSNVSGMLDALEQVEPEIVEPKFHISIDGVVARWSVQWFEEPQVVSLDFFAKPFPLDL